MMLIDTDVLLDEVFQRDPYWIESADLLSYAKNSRIPMGVTSTILSNLYYRISKYKSDQIATVFNRGILELT